MILALLTSLAWNDPAAAPLRRLPVVLTTDCGAEVDDQWALVHLALSPELDLRGIVTTHAPNLAEPAAEASARAAHRDARPHRQGCPASGDRRFEPSAARRRAPAQPRVEFLLDQARGRSAEDRLVVVVIGAATDVASALRTDPTFADRVTIVAMAFERLAQGRRSLERQERCAGVACPPRSNAPIVVGDGAVGKRHLSMTVAKARSLFEHAARRARPSRNLLEGWLEANGETARSPPVPRTRGRHGTR
jgi:hypothetical protein